jgi:hypothetical protein
MKQAFALFFSLMSAFSTTSFAATNEDALWNWASRFQQYYFDLANGLPAHEASVPGVTSTGQRCRLEIFHENGYLAIGLSLVDPAERDVSSVSNDQRLNSFSVDGGNLNADAIEHGRHNTLKVEGSENGSVKKATGKSKGFPEGITSLFIAPQTS